MTLCSKRNNLLAITFNPLINSTLSQGSSVDEGHPARGGDWSSAVDPSASAGEETQFGVMNEKEISFPFALFVGLSATPEAISCPFPCHITQLQLLQGTSTGTAVDHLDLVVHSSVAFRGRNWFSFRRQLSNNSLPAPNFLLFSFPSPLSLPMSSASAGSEYLDRCMCP